MTLRLQKNLRVILVMSSINPLMMLLAEKPL